MDSGFLSRKFWYSVGTSLAVLGVGLLAAYWPPFRTNLEAVIGGLIGVLALYSGSNITNKWVNRKIYGPGTQEDTREDPKELETPPEDE